MVQKWFDMDFFRVLCRMHCNTFFAFLAIARLAKVDRNVAGDEWFSVDYERSRFIFTPPVSGGTGKCADGLEVTEGGHNENFPV